MRSVEKAVQVGCQAPSDMVPCFALRDQVSEFASQTDDESSSEVLPSQPSERDLASLLLAKPTLTRSETKSTIAARIAASGRSDVMADGGGLSDLRPALPVPSLGPRGHSSPMAKVSDAIMPMGRLEV